MEEWNEQIAMIEHCSRTGPHEGHLWRATQSATGRVVFFDCPGVKKTKLKLTKRGKVVVSVITPLAIILGTVLFIFIVGAMEQFL